MGYRSFVRSLIPRKQLAMRAAATPRFAIARMHACTHAHHINVCVHACRQAGRQAGKQASRQRQSGSGDEGNKGYDKRICRTSTHQHVCIRALRDHARNSPPPNFAKSARRHPMHTHTIARVHARECEITRGDGRGQRLRATRS